MAKISEYTAVLGDALGATDQFVVNDSGTTKRIDASELGEGVRRLGGVINVKDYGATGDGTTNDYTAIQAAITACPAGGSVFFPKGTYEIGTGLTCAVAAPRFIGEGAVDYSGTPVGSVIRGTAASMVMFTYDVGSLTHTGPSFENLSFINKAATHTMTGLKIRRANHWTVRECAFIGNAIGLHLDAVATDCSWGLLEQCSFYSNTAGVETINIAGMVVLGGRFTGIAGTTALNLISGDQHRIIGAKFDAGAYQIKAFNSATLIDSCIFESADTAAIWLGGGGAGGDDGKYHHVTNCHINADTAASGVLIDSSIVTPPLLLGNTWTSGCINVTDNSTVGYRRLADDKGNFGTQRTVTTTHAMNSVTPYSTYTDTYLCNAAGGAFTITLPDPDGSSGPVGKTPFKGRRWTFKKIDSGGNDVTISQFGSETIDGATTYVLANAYEKVTLECDGTNWWTV